MHYGCVLCIMVALYPLWLHFMHYGCNLWIMVVFYSLWLCFIHYGPILYIMLNFMHHGCILCSMVVFYMCVFYSFFSHSKQYGCILCIMSVLHYENNDIPISNRYHSDYLSRIYITPYDQSYWFLKYTLPTRLSTSSSTHFQHGFPLHLQHTSNTAFHFILNTLPTRLSTSSSTQSE